MDQFIWLIQASAVKAVGASSVRLSTKMYHEKIEIGTSW
jgi:hypothetical protein